VSAGWINQNENHPAIQHYPYNQDLKPVYEQVIIIIIICLIRYGCTQVFPIKCMGKNLTSISINYRD
jgi:hypothetical protein